MIKYLGGHFERRGTEVASAVIVLVPRLAGLLRSEGIRAPVHVIPSGVVPDQFHSGDLHGDPLLAAIPRPRVVFLGRLHAQKQVDTLVRAAASLPRAQVVLVGDGPERGGLERLARRLGVADRVHFCGFVPHDRVPAVLRSADVMALPSRYEELGSALLEAMEAGVPIVASATGGIPDVITDERNGLLVPPADPEAMARAIGRLLADQTLSSRLARAGREEVAHYDWNLLAKRVLGVYADVLSGRAARSDGRPSQRM
jgi:glycosyltransferase involved in cell wall biosynthesis